MGINNMIKDKSGYRLKFMRNLGCSLFQIGVVEYNRGGVLPKWITIFKIPRNTAVDDERVVHTRYQAYRDAPKHYSRKEVEEITSLLHRTTQVSVRLLAAIAEGFFTEAAFNWKFGSQK